MKRLAAVCAVFTLLSAWPAFADNYRCPNGNIVSTGDYISTVAAKCDPPAGMTSRTEPVETDITKEDGKKGTKTVYIEVQEWAYTQGSTLLHTLIFRNGILEQVITGGFVR
jgi:hypothetical protein